MSFSFIGAGSPLVDYTVAVSDAFLQQYGCKCKGGTEHINAKERAGLFAAFNGKFLRTPGGAAANTVCALGRLGVKCSFFGKLGNDDDGNFFRDELIKSQVSADELIFVAGDTGCCISLVTPDAERTMRSDLGVSTMLDEHDFNRCDFGRYDWLLSEGYMLQIPRFETIFSRARQAGCRIALDVSSIEIARNNHNKIIALLASSVNLVFCNELEAAALTGNNDPEYNVAYLSGICGMAVVKLGAAGSLVKAENSGIYRIPAYNFGAAVDTTAAGDHYAAGFFYGLAMQKDLETCGVYGSVLGSAAAAVHGSRITGELWTQVVNIINNQ